MFGDVGEGVGFVVEAGLVVEWDVGCAVGFDRAFVREEAAFDGDAAAYVVGSFAGFQGSFYGWCWDSREGCFGHCLGLACGCELVFGWLS